jgi:short-subunit dehydrogenase
VRVTHGTCALVTGASRGIGRALAEAIAARGATVGLAARSADELEALAAALPGRHHVLPCDVTEAAAVAGAVDTFVQRAGGLDLVVANAGVSHYEPFREQPIERALSMSEVNWHGTLFTVHAALPALLARGAGHVVVVSAGAGLRSFPGAAVYGATKAAQRAFAEALRHELDGTGVSVTVVLPGEITTGLHAHERDRLPEWYRGGEAAASPHALAARVLEAVEYDERAVVTPWFVRLLGAAHGVSPRAADAVMRRLRGASAAPRRD